MGSQSLQRLLSCLHGLPRLPECLYEGSYNWWNALIDWVGVWKKVTRVFRPRNHVVHLHKPANQDPPKRGKRFVIDTLTNGLSYVLGRDLGFFHRVFFWSFTVKYIDQCHSEVYLVVTHKVLYKKIGTNSIIQVLH